ncbi:MAG: hypothetical protein N3C59_03230 [Azovibrio sp.]|nr:hypothetical protein [Azovibrio sp.]
MKTKTGILYKIKKNDKENLAGQAHEIQDISDPVRNALRFPPPAHSRAAAHTADTPHPSA